MNWNGIKLVEGILGRLGGLTAWAMILAFYKTLRYYVIEWTEISLAD